MQKRLLAILFIIGSLLLVAFKYARQEKRGIQPDVRRAVLNAKKVIACTPDWSALNEDSLANNISILPGWGNYPWPLKSTHDSAARYFQQGINMYFSFHIIEAMASFKKAARFDSTHAMIHWAQALSYGPNINDFAYAYTPEAYAAAQKAVSLSANCTVKEKALIKAMSVRYTPDSTVSRSSLNELYTAEMEKASRQLPGDADIAALYADAMMLLHPWDVWKHNGQPQPWTPKLLDVLEKALLLDSSHPGANHYYIHSIEASPNPERAIPSANRLSVLMPSVSHMVHMPSHIYIRTGSYSEGMKVNEMALEGYKDYLNSYPAVSGNSPLYAIHNLHMQAACAMLGANYEYSAHAAEASRSSFDSSFLSMPPPFSGYVQYVYMTPVINEVRFGKWDAILERPLVPQVYSYASVLHHWARGMAYARKKLPDSAKAELALMREVMKHPDLLVVMEPFNAPISGAKVAENLLEGVMAEENKDLAGAIKMYAAAVENEAAMIYTEPKDWILPPQPWLGAALLKAGAYSKAEAVFRADLRENPKNHWALEGLYRTLQKQQKHGPARVVKIQLNKALAAAKLQNMPVIF